MVRRSLLNMAPPRLEQHMIDQDRPLTAKEVEELTGLSTNSAHTVLAYMMAVKKIDRVKIGGRYRYFLKGYDEGRIKALMEEERRRKAPRISFRRRAASGERWNKDLEEEYREFLRTLANSGKGPPGLAILGLSEQNVSRNDVSIVDVSPDERFLDAREAEEEFNEGLMIRHEPFGKIEDLPGDVSLLTIGDTRYLKEHHLSGIAGYEGIKDFPIFFVENSALERREYGNVFYVSMGTNHWNYVEWAVVRKPQSSLEEEM